MALHGALVGLMWTYINTSIKTYNNTSIKLKSFVSVFHEYKAL